MSKRKKRRNPGSQRKKREIFTPDNPRTPRRFAEGMYDAQELMRKKRWQEALQILAPLNRRYPGQPDLLESLVNIYLELDDIQSYQSALLSLIKVAPDRDDAMYGLAGSYLMTMRPVLAYQTFKQCLERWPKHENAKQATKTLADLEAMLPTMFEELGIPMDEAGFALAIKHEEMQVALSSGETRAVLRIANAILKDYPHFASAHNNLSLAYWLQGNLDKAIATAQTMLDMEPDNVHALSNIVHFLYVSGQHEQALRYADALRTSPAPASEKHIKQMEGLIFVEDYAAILDIFEQAKAEGELDLPVVSPMLYHLPAVAAACLGDEKQARALWRQALKQERGFQLAKDNLDDLKRPVGERNGPHAFPFTHWLNQKATQELEKLTGLLDKSHNDRAIASSFRMFIRKHPEIQPVLPALLKRGDTGGRMFALAIARTANTPEMQAILKDYAFSAYGPDADRMEIANFLLEQGVISSGARRMYMRGEWRDDVLLLGFMVGDESDNDEHFPPSITKMMEQAAEALNAGDPDKAEYILQRALQARPNSPGLLNNLAVAYEMQGQSEKAHAMVREIHEQHPDYLFARTALARMAMNEGDLERAHDLLDPLMQRRKLHFSEFNQMMAAFIDLYLAEDNLEAARGWLDMWEASQPDASQLAAYKLRVGAPGLSKWLMRKT